mgnify:CR=1 FL=1
MWSLFFVFMAVQAILGQKIEQSQKFLEDGTRIPVTQLWVKGNVVVAVKTPDKHNYSAIQLGFGTRKKATKALLGQTKGAGLTTAPKFLKEIRMADADSLPEIGRVINVTEILKPGDIINVTGISKGKGYAGVVKRHHFKGGPRTHGQSDRERAPGSIGQTTTPGRVYKGKRMAGRMGHETATIRNLEVLDVSADLILVKGLVPGGRNSLIMVKKVSENKKFVPLYKEAVETGALPQISDDVRQEEDQSTENSASLSESQSKKSDEKQQEGAELAFSSSETGQVSDSEESTISSSASDQSPSTTEIISSSESEQTAAFSGEDSNVENKENKKEKQEVKDAK